MSELIGSNGAATTASPELQASSSAVRCNVLLMQSSEDRSRAATN